MNRQRKRQNMENTYKATKIVKTRDDECLRQDRDNENVKEKMNVNVTQEEE